MESKFLILAAYGAEAVACNAGPALPKEWASALMRMVALDHTGQLPARIGSPHRVATTAWWSYTVKAHEVAAWAPHLPGLDECPGCGVDTTIRALFNALPPASWARVALLLAGTPLLPLFKRAVPTPAGLWSTVGINTVFPHHVVSEVYAALWAATLPTLAAARQAFVHAASHTLAVAGAKCRNADNPEEGWRAWAEERSVFITPALAVDSVDYDPLLGGATVAPEVPRSVIFMAPPQALGGLAWECVSSSAGATYTIPRIMRPLWALAQLWIQEKEKEVEGIPVANLSLLPLFPVSKAAPGQQPPCRLVRRVIGDAQPSDVSCATCPSLSSPDDLSVVVSKDKWAPLRVVGGSGGEGKNAVVVKPIAGKSLMSSPRQIPYQVFESPSAIFTATPEVRHAQFLSEVDGVPLPASPDSEAGVHARSLWALVDEDQLSSARAQLSLWAQMLMRRGEAAAAFGWVPRKRGGRWFGLVSQDGMQYAPLPHHGVQVVRLKEDAPGSGVASVTLRREAGAEASPRPMRLGSSDGPFVQTRVIRRATSACWADGAAAAANTALHSGGDVWRVVSGEDSRFPTNFEQASSLLWPSLVALNGAPIQGRCASYVRIE